MDFPGGVFWPQPLFSTQAVALSSPTALTASTHQIAICGRVSFLGTGTKDITRVHLLWGAITKAGGSGMTIALQDVSASAGQPMRPDGTDDQTVAVANGDAGFVTDGWYRSGSLSSTRAVANSDLLAVVLKFDAGGRLGADSVTVRGLTISPTAGVTPGQSQQAQVVRFDGTTWAAAGLSANVLLEFTDGTFGAFEMANYCPVSGMTSYAFNTGTAARDEAGFQYQPDTDQDVDGVWFSMTSAAAADYDMVIYDGTTQVVTESVDATQTASTVARTNFVPLPRTTLSAGVTYNVAIKPTTASNVTIYTVSVDSASHLALQPGGGKFPFVSRVDAGSWTSPTTTERVLAGFRLVSVASGGGGAIPPFNGLLVTR